MTDLYGCSDHNCIYGHKGGMGTNGGCSCEKGLLRIEPDGRKAARQIRLLRAENELLRAGLINIRDRFNAFAATDVPLQYRYDQLANAIAAALSGEGD